MERGYIEKAKFVYRDKKIQLDKLYIKFEKINEGEIPGLMKTSFKTYLNNKLVGYVPLDMLAILPLGTKDKPSLQIVLKTSKPQNFDKLPFAHKMKTKQFLGKIFKQDGMVEENKNENLVVVSKEKTKRRKRK